MTTVTTVTTYPKPQRSSGYSCDQDDCTFVAKSVGHLKRHTQDIHNSDISYWYPCKESGCTYTANNLKHIKKHKESKHNYVNLTEKWLRCPEPECICKVRTKNSLRKHPREVHYAVGNPTKVLPKDPTKL